MLSKDFYKTEKICDKTYLIRDYYMNSMYLLEGNDAALLIDTGWGICNIHETVLKLTSKPLLCVLTHGHLDHAGGAYSFDNVYMNSIDKTALSEMLSYDIKSFSINHIIKNIVPEDLSTDEWYNIKFQKTKDLPESHIFKLGGRDVEIIETPGHTMGSIMLYDKNSKLLFTGDNINSKQIWINFDHSADINEFIKSIQKIVPYKKYIKALATPHSYMASTSLIDEALLLLNDIANNNIKGEIFNTFVGNGVIYKNKHLEIVCKA